MMVAAIWAKRLLLDTGKVLHDREIIEPPGLADATRIVNLHVWRVDAESLPV